MTCTFTDPVGLSGCIRLAIYHAWGTTVQQAYPTFKDYACALTDTSIRTAVANWDTNPTAAARTYGPIGVWNTAAVGNMTALFESKTKFNANLAGWNVARVSTMDSMFDRAKSFNSDLVGWNVASVSSMFGTFNAASAFNSDLAAWNVSRVMSMEGMFEYAKAFDRNIAGWNVLSVKALDSAPLRFRPLHRSCAHMPPSFCATRRVSASFASPEDVFCRANPDFLSAVCCRPNGCSDRRHLQRARRPERVHEAGHLQRLGNDDAVSLLKLQGQ